MQWSLEQGGWNSTCRWGINTHTNTHNHHPRGGKIVRHTKIFGARIPSSFSPRPPVHYSKYPPSPFVVSDDAFALGTESMRLQRQSTLGEWSEPRNLVTEDTTTPLLFWDSADRR